MKTIKGVIILLTVLIASGCLTTGYKNNDPSIKKLIRNSGTAKNISTNFLTDTQKVIGNKASFSFDEPKVVWWGQVWDYTSLPLKLHAKWLDPEGGVHKEYDFFALGNLSGIISTALPIRNHISPKQAGQWKAIISFRGLEVSREEFYIGGMVKNNKELTEDELKEIFPDLDNADALVLLKDVRVEVDKNYSTKIVSKRRIMIRSDRGEKMYSVIHIPFYSALESVDVNLAHTIKANGDIVEVKEMQMFSPFEDYPGYRASQILGIAMPSVEKGSIIEYEIETTSSMSQALPSFWSEFSFNQLDPVLNSKYVVVCPDNFSLKISESKVDCRPKISNEESKKTKIYTWEKNNIQAIKLEKNMPSPREILSSISVYTSSSWEEVAMWWDALSKDKTVFNSAIDSKAKELTKDCSNGLDKIKQIFSFVQSEVRYIQVRFGASPYQPVSAMETFKNKYGDCKDQTTLLISMLRSVGVKDVCYGLVRTKDEGPINKMAANPSEFNHVIAVVKVNGKEIFLDPTAKSLEFGITPFSLQGTEALVINSGAGYFVGIPVSRADDNQIYSVISLNIHDDLKIDGELEIQYTGQSEWLARSYLESMNPDQRNDYMRAILNEVYPGANLKEYLIKHEKNLGKHLEYDMQFSLLNWLEKVNDAYLLKVMNDKLLSPPEYLTPDRNYTIRRDYAGVTKAKITIVLPSNIVINSLPRDFSIDTSHLASSIRYDQKGSKITREQMIMDFSVDISNEDIPEYKNTWDDIFNAHKEGIVLFRK